MSIRLCVLALALALPNYCLAAKPFSVPIPVAPELQVEMIESQQEIAVTVPATAQAIGMQFGLIGALIGSAVQNAQVKNAEEAIVPVRNLLVDYRFNQKMQEALQAKLASEGLSPVPVLTVMATPWEAHDAEQAAKLPPRALVLVPGYAMDSDFSQVTVSLRATLVDRVVKSNGKIKAVPSFTRLYSFQFPLLGERSDEPVNDWVAFESAGLAQLLDQGIAQVTDMLAHDFSAEGRAAWETNPKKESAVINGNVYAGAPVRQGEGWAWVRNGKGRMQSLQGFQPLVVGTFPVKAAAAPTVVAAAQPRPVAEASISAANATPANAAAGETVSEHAPGSSLVAPDQAAPANLPTTPAAMPVAPAEAAPAVAPAGS